MAYLVKAPRVGRSQGAVIFWGLVSAFFASAFCYYYLENRTNEEKNRTLLDQVMILQGERDSLSSERDKMEEAASDTEKQLHEREDFLQEKETNLAEEESQLEAAGPPSPSQLSQQQAATVKRFDEAARQIAARSANADVVLRGGRPVLRLPSSIFFADGDTQLTAGGEADLDQMAQAVRLPPGRFELRVETFTDRAGETAPVSRAGGAGANVLPATPGPGAVHLVVKPSVVDAWTLTAGRAAAIAHYLRDHGPLPFQDVIAMGRADGPPIGAAPDGSGRSRRIEITLAPVPAPFHVPAAKSPRAQAVAIPATGPLPAATDSSSETGAP